MQPPLGMFVGVMLLAAGFAQSQSTPRFEPSECLFMLPNSFGVTVECGCVVVPETRGYSASRDTARTPFKRG